MKKTVLLTISGPCNLECDYCHLTYDKTHMTLELVQDILSKHSKDEYIILSGGEPTINPYFADIITWLEEDGWKGQVITNGSHILKFLHLFKTFRINLSLSTLKIDKFDPKDKITMRVLPSLMSKYPNKITLSAVFNGNFEEARLLIDFVKMNGLNLTYNLYTQIADPDPLKINYHNPDMCYDVDELRKFVEYYAANYEDDWFITPDVMRDYFHHYAEGRFWHCDSKTTKKYYRNYFPGGGGIQEIYCCITKDDPEQCAGCLDVCALQNDRPGNN